MGSAESIVDIDISELAQAGTEGLDSFGVSLDLLAVSILAGTFFLNVETKVLEENDLAAGGSLACLLNLRTDAVRKESNWLAEELLDFLGNRCEGVLLLNFAVGTTQVRHEHDRAGTLLEGVLDGRQGLDNTVVVGDHAILERYVEVDTVRQDTPVPVSTHITQLNTFQSEQTYRIRTRLSFKSTSRIESLLDKDMVLERECERKKREPRTIFFGGRFKYASVDFV